MAKKGSVTSLNRHRPFWEKACEDLKERLTVNALRLTNGKVYDAEDLLQGTFCRILMYPRNPEKVRTPIAYLLTIMRNIWKDKWRKERTAKMESWDQLRSQEAHEKGRAIAEPAVDPDALRILENNELRAEMRANQGPLTPREELLLALYLKGYTCKEIAIKCNADVRLVRSSLNAVRTKVRGRLIRARALKLP